MCMHMMSPLSIATYLASYVKMRQLHLFDGNLLSCLWHYWDFYIKYVHILSKQTFGNNLLMNVTTSLYSII